MPGGRASRRVASRSFDDLEKGFSGRCDAGRVQRRVVVEWFDKRGGPKE